MPAPPEGETAKGPREDFLWQGQRSSCFSRAEESKNLWYKYSTALHWSLTQFTPASMEVMPQNEYERFFTVCFSGCNFVSYAGTTFMKEPTAELQSLPQNGPPLEFKIRHRRFRSSSLSWATRDSFR